MKEQSKDIDFDKHFVIVSRYWKNTMIALVVMLFVVDILMAFFVYDNTKARNVYDDLIEVRRSQFSSIESRLQTLEKNNNIQSTTLSLPDIESQKIEKK